MKPVAGQWSEGLGHWLRGVNDGEMNYGPF